MRIAERAVQRKKNAPEGAFFVTAATRLLCAANVECASFATFRAIEVAARFGAHFSAWASVGLAYANHGRGFFRGTGGNVHRALLSAGGQLRDLYRWIALRSGEVAGECSAG